jgi:hypothetical protein
LDFLLECIGFSPAWDLEAVTKVIRERGEPTAWRGRDGEHLRLPLAGGLELRLDRDGSLGPALWPFYTSRFRRRVALWNLERLADSPGDAILIGRTDPPAPSSPFDHDEGHDLTCYLTDAARLPRHLPRGHVLAIMLAGFALQVDFLGPNEDGPNRYETGEDLLESPHGAAIAPLGDPDAPAACMQLSMRIRTVSHLKNDLTGAPVDRIELDAPGTPLEVFISPWQLAEDDLPPPRPGMRIEGTFLMLGRIVGALPQKRRRDVAFG